MVSRAWGRVKVIEIKSLGDTLAADVPTGSNELVVNDVTLFDDRFGGLLRLGSEVLRYTKIDDDREVVVLAEGTTEPHEAGEDVILLPETTEMSASVVMNDGTELPDGVRIPHRDQPSFPIHGQRDPDDMERMLLRYEGGTYVYEDMWGVPKVISGEAIVGPLPNAEIPSVTPVAPSSSPTPTVTGYAGLLQVRFDGVPNDTFVDYDIHVAATNANPPSESTLLFNTAATIEAVRELPDGTPLAYDTDYFVAVWAKSGDQYAAGPSPWVSGRMDRTRSADLAVDALDGRVITGSTLRTAASGARVQIDTANGLVGYAPDGTTKKTQVDAVTGRIYAEDGTFTGSLVGGNISIAQGVASTLDQDFETASGTTPPSGWTRQVTSASLANAGVLFDTSGGQPGRRLRLQTRAGASGTAIQATYPTGVQGQDVAVAFDYMWSGSPGNGVGNGQFLRLRIPEDRASNWPYEGVYVEMAGGGLRVWAAGLIATVPGFDRYALNPTAATPGAWYRVELVLRGASVNIRAYPKGSTPTAWTSGAITNLVPRSGVVAFSVEDRDRNVDQAVHVDNVHIEVLQTGFFVGPDGKATVERLVVGQSIIVPDPLMPTDAVNLQSLSGNPIAFPLNSGYSMHTFGSRPYYRRVSKDFVKVGGVITKSSGNFGTSFEDIGQLPAGFRCDTGDSQNQQFFMLGATAATTYGRARVADNGTISVQASATASYLPIDGILIDLRATRAAL